jgi:phosphoribosylpyrophosphate synthetase
VPSTRRPTGSPLGAVPGVAVAACAPLGAAEWLPTALVRAVAPIGHMAPDASAFRVRESLRGQLEGRRVLLLDDTYVSGARSQSAAAALRIAGARSVVILVLGRVLRPDRSVLHAAFLDRHRRPFVPRHTRPGDPHGPCSRCVETLV